MRRTSIIVAILLAISVAGCSKLQNNYVVSQRVHAKYPDAQVQIAYHSDGTRGLVVSFEVKSLSDLNKSDPLDTAREIGIWMNDWPDDGRPWRDVTVKYIRYLIGNLIKISNSETVGTGTLRSI